MRRSSLLSCTALLLLLVALAAPVALANEVASDAAPSAPTPAAAPVLPEFIPTDEWQVVLPGQSVPPGLWVRMDMTTGQRTARLLPEEERNDAAKKRDAAAAELSADGVHSIVQQQQQQKEDKSGGLVLVPDETSQSSGGPVIRELAAPGSEVPRDSEPVQGSDASLLAARAARLASLKSNFYLKEDVETMKQLLAICVDGDSSVPAVRRALEVLEELVHQVDNANDFATIGGMDVVLTILQQDAAEVATESAADAHAVAPEGTAQDNLAANATESSSPVDAAAVAAATAAAVFDASSEAAAERLLRLYQLQSSAAWVLGTAAQNNRQVQDRARRDGAIPILTTLLRQTVASSDAEHGVQSLELRSARLKLAAKALYALSALLRHNARSQDAFHLVQGAEALRFTWQTTPWTKCRPSAAEGSEVEVAEVVVRSPAGCLSASEELSLFGLRGAVSQKSLALVHDLLADRLVNAHEATQRAERKAQVLAAAAAHHAAEAERKGETQAETAAAVEQAAADESAAAASAGVGNARVVPPADLLHGDLSSSALVGSFVSASAEWALHALAQASWPLGPQAGVPQHSPVPGWGGACSSPSEPAAPTSLPLVDVGSFKYHEPDCTLIFGDWDDEICRNRAPKWNVQAFRVRQTAISILNQLLQAEELQQQQQQEQAVRIALRPHVDVLTQLREQAADWLKSYRTAEWPVIEEISSLQQHQFDHLQQVINKLA